MVTSIIFFIIGIIMLSYGIYSERKIRKQDSYVKRCKNRLNMVTIMFIIIFIMSLVALISAIRANAEETLLFNQIVLVCTWALFSIYEVLFDSQVVICKRSILYRTVIVDKRNITTFYNEEKNKYFMYIGDKTFKIAKNLYDELN